MNKLISIYSTYFFYVTNLSIAENRSVTNKSDNTISALVAPLTGITFSSNQYSNNFAKRDLELCQVN